MSNPKNYSLLFNIISIIFLSTNSLISSFGNQQLTSDLVDLTDYEYPKPSDSSSDIIKIAILGTNDFHGKIFPDKFLDTNRVRYSNAGAIYLYSYAKILREQWGKNFLWLDGGDQFQGTLECMLSDCSIMKDFYNFVNVDAIAIGNHEFDYGVDLLREHIKKQKYTTLCANIYDKKEKKYIYEEGMWEGVEPYHIYTLGGGETPEIRVGVIGLATKDTISFTATHLDWLDFTDYFEETKKWTDFLRKEKKVDSVILLPHFGPRCSNDGASKTDLKMRNKNSKQKECEDTFEIMEFLKKIKKNDVKIDAVIGAHVHDIVHHWISDIPVIESSGSNYFNILYLPFKKNKDGSLTLINSDIEIEGPVPVCEKLWPDNKKCNFREKDSKDMKNFIFHNKTLLLDEGLMESLSFWDKIIEEKVNNTLVVSEVEMQLDYVKENILSNFITDIGKVVTDSDICFYNLGGIRTKWHKGEINEIDIFKMFPFNNTWVRFDMTGVEVVRMFTELNEFQMYPASGVLQTFKKSNGRNILIDISFWDGKNILPIYQDKTYKVCTNDFTAGGGEDMGKVRKWYKELRNQKNFGIIRERFIEYAKKMEVINEEFFLNIKYPPRVTFYE